MDSKGLSRISGKGASRLLTSGLFFVVATTLVTAQHAPATPPVADYVVGPQDVLTITCYDQNDLSGKFTVEADGTFTYPLIGRLTAGGLTLKQVESSLKRRLKDEGYFTNPQITAAVEQYKSQRVFVVGEVRTPGTYPLSGSMTLIELLARAGSTLPTARGEVVIVHAGEHASGPSMPSSGEDDHNVAHVSLRDLENGMLSQNAGLQNGDTVFVPRAESIYVFGQVKSPGAYALQQKDTTVLQALSLAGGVTDHGSTGRIRIIRIINGEKREIHVRLTDVVQPRDTIVVRERFF